MADRQLPELRSRLRLDTTDLTRAQGAAERFVTRLNATKLDTKSLDEFSSKADQLGSKFTRNVTLPVLAGATAATKLAVDFESSFTQMQTLAGVTGDEVEGLKQHVIDLAKATGRSPDDLAKGLYFIRSAGIEGSTALDILDASAKGAAIGLGDTASVADVLTSAINTYGSANLSATDAAGQLAAAVAAGKGEAADFAPQLGRLLPIAQNLGVGFDQVAGSVSFLTQTNGDVARSATMVEGVFQKLLSPVGQAEETLSKYGLTSNGVRKYLADNGLIATLQMLNEKLGGNRDALRSVFQDTEAVNGVLGLLRNNGTDAAKVIDNVTSSTDYLADAYKKLDDDPATNFKRDLAELQAEGIALGQKLIPLLADLAGNVADVVGWFARLPEPIQTALVAFVGLAAVVGPTAKGLGYAGNAVSLLIKASKSDAVFSFSTAMKEGAASGQGFAAAAGNAAGAVGALGPVGLIAAGGLVALASSFLEAQAGAARTKADIADLLDLMEQGSSPIEAFNKKLAATLADTDGGFNLNISGDEVRRSLKGADVDAKELSAALTGTNAEFEALKGKVKDNLGTTAFSLRLIGQLEALRNKGEKAAGQFDAMGIINRELGVSSDDTTAALADQTGATTDLTSQSEEASKALEEQASAARSLFDARQAASASVGAVLSAEQELAEARRAATGDSDEMRSALDGVTDAEKGLADAKHASSEAEQGLNDARKEAAKNLRDLEQAAAGAVVSEGRAQLALEEAKRDAFLVKPGTDYFAQREADQKVAEAQQALSEASTKRTDSAQELADARAKGIEGSDAVVAAQERISDAYDQEGEAQKRVADAADQVAKVRADAAAKVKDATEKLTAAQLDNIDKQAELIEKVYGAEAGNQALLDGLFRLAVSLDPANPLRARLGGFITDLLALKQAYEGVPDPSVWSQLGADGTPLAQYYGGGSRRTDGPRAQGGAVYPGRAYDVNEMSRFGVPSEVFVPDVPGRIVAGNQAASATPTINMPVQVMGNPDAATIAEFEKAGGRMIDAALRNYTQGLRR